VTADPCAIRQDGPDVLLHVRLQPRASRNQVVLAEDPGSDSIGIRVTAPPAEGAANAACRALLAEILGVAKSRIVLVHGHTARTKLFRVRQADAASVLARLQSPK